MQSVPSTTATRIGNTRVDVTGLDARTLREYASVAVPDGQEVFIERKGGRAFLVTR